jgi:hypothetical protein
MKEDQVCIRVLLTLGALVFLVGVIFQTPTTLGVTTATATTTVTVSSSAPIVNVVTIPSPITLTTGGAGTTTINVNATIYDYNGCTDFSNGSATIALYLNNGGTPSSTCIAGGVPGNGYNCYVATAFTNSTCTTYTATVTTTFGVYSFAAVTDTSTYNGKGWIATVIFRNPSNTTGTKDSTASPLSSFLAINVNPSSINFGANLTPSQTSTVTSTAVQNYGNVSTTVQLSATTILTNAQAAVIGADYEHYASATFTYGGSEPHLSTTTPAPNVPGFVVSNPTTTAITSGSIFWGLQVPTGTPTGTFNGINLFTAVQQ